MYALVVQVYLGKWQETDVAVKVLIEMQHLAPTSSVQPQDPATLEPWTDRPDPNTMPAVSEDAKVHAEGLAGITDADAAEDGQVQAEVGPESTAAMRTLEREVCLLFCGYCTNSKFLLLVKT